MWSTLCVSSGDNAMNRACNVFSEDIIWSVRDAISGDTIPNILRFDSNNWLIVDDDIAVPSLLLLLLTAIIHVVPDVGSLPFCCVFVFCLVGWFSLFGDYFTFDLHTKWRSDPWWRLAEGGESHHQITIIGLLSAHLRVQIRGGCPIQYKILTDLWKHNLKFKMCFYFEINQFSH